MKKIVICLLIVLFIFVVVIAYSIKNERYNFKLRIKESSWSGWVEGYEPQEVTKEYDVGLGKEYSINSGNFIFSIEKINSDNIIIKTSQTFSDKENGIDLNSKKNKFTIYLDKETELTTPTMDEGAIYYLKLVK